MADRQRVCVRVCLPSVCVRYYMCLTSAPPFTLVRERSLPDVPHQRQVCVSRRRDWLATFPRWVRASRNPRRVISGVPSRPRYVQRVLSLGSVSQWAPLCSPPTPNTVMGADADITGRTPAPALFLRGDQFSSADEERAGREN